MTDTTTHSWHTVRPISWLATIPQFVAGAAAIALGWFLTRTLIGAAWGTAGYLIYSYGSRALMSRAHDRGMQLSRSHRFEEAILAFTESYEFFSRHSWLDRYRSITMMTPSSMGYREMALVNIAACQFQIGDLGLARESYERVLEEFSENDLALAAIRLIDSLEHPTDNGGIAS